MKISKLFDNNEYHTLEILNQTQLIVNVVSDNNFLGYFS